MFRPVPANHSALYHLINTLIVLPVLALFVLLTGLTSPARASLQFVEALYGGPVLDDAYNLAMSPDGNHLYAVGYFSSTIAVYARQGTTGALDLVEVQRDGVGGVEGLDGITNLTVAPDGRHLYAVSEWDNGVALFQRDGTSGRLTFVETCLEGGGGVEGIEGAAAVLVSPDNRHVYVADYMDDGVALFQRDDTSGRLTYVEVYQDQVDGVVGIAGAIDLAFSADGRHLYVVGTYDDGLAVFSRDATTGRLTFMEAFFDDTDGVEGLCGAVGVSVSPDGGHVYVVGEFDDAIAVFERNNTTGRLTFASAAVNDVGGITGLEGVNDIGISADGAYLYVTGYYLDDIVVLARDSGTGALSFVQMLQDDTAGVDGLYGARSIAVSADGAHIYAIGEYDNAVARFNRDAATGQLSYAGLNRDQYDGVDGLYGVVAVALSPDGRHLYSAGYNDDAVAVFSRDSQSGALTYIEVHKDGVNGVDGIYRASAVALSPDGVHLYVAGYYDSAVAVFSRDADSGRLTFIGAYHDGVDGVDGLRGARDVIVSPDGGHVVVAGYLEDAVAVFARDATTGALSFQQVVFDNTDGVNGLDGIRSLAFSPDGGYLYTAARSDSAVAAFRRDAATGTLTFLAMQRDNLNGTEGLYGVRGIALDPDGASLYAAGHYDDAVAVFTADGQTGLLSYLEMHADTDTGVDGLNGANAVTVSPDGGHAYVAGYYDNAVASFIRDAATGRLTFEEMLQDGTGGVDGLKGVSRLAVSPDGRHLYAAGEYDSAIAVFSTVTDDSGDSTPSGPAGSDGGSGGCFIANLL